MSLTRVLKYKHLFTHFKINKSLDILDGDRIPVEARFSAPVQTGPGAHPASYTMDTGSLPGGKAAGAWS
jgi:hypothetical protein